MDYSSRKMDRYYKLITVYRGKESIFFFPQRLEMYRAFQRGLRELPLSERRLSSDDFNKFKSWIGNSYDILITGSDAIWNYKKRRLPNPYFLSLPLEVKRLSYAASCNGLRINSYRDILPEQRDYLKKSFKQFDYIGTRDLQTERLVKEVCPQATVLLRKSARRLQSSTTVIHHCC